jgi:DNA replication protein DnaC
LSDIEVETDKEATNMRHIFTWMSHFKQNEGQISGFLMTGNVGSGKTHIACAMGRAVLTMGASFRYMTHEAINNRLRATWNKYTTLTQEEVIKSLSTVHLLAIDELAECNSLELRKALSSLIDQRYNAERPTILISNKRMDAIKSILGDRIYSRNCNGILEFDGRDRRMDDNPFMM